MLRKKEGASEGCSQACSLGISPYEHIRQWCNSSKWGRIILVVEVKKSKTVIQSCLNLRVQSIIREWRFSPKGEIRCQGRLCVPDVGDLRHHILVEAHNSRYSIHPGATKMYRDLREVYWWNDIKRDIANFVSKCPNCQQVKVEHQKQGGMTQEIDIPTWKWDVINMDFIT